MSETIKKEPAGLKSHPDAFKKFFYKNAANEELEIYNARNGSVPMIMKVKGVEYRQSILKAPIYIAFNLYKPKSGDWVFRNATMVEVGELAKIATEHANTKKKFPTRQQRRHYERACIDSYKGTPVAVKLEQKLSYEQPDGE